MFRTATGQTGPDAYMYEASQILNCQRELDGRAARLARVMADELPESVSVKWAMPSAAHPDFFHEWDERDALAKVLIMNGSGRDAKALLDIARALANSDHIIDQRNH